jgi:hypothetical protein
MLIGNVDGGHRIPVYEQSLSNRRTWFASRLSRSADGLSPSISIRVMFRLLMMSCATPHQTTLVDAHVAAMMTPSLS